MKTAINRNRGPHRWNFFIERNLQLRLHVLTFVARRSGAAGCRWKVYVDECDLRFAGDESDRVLFKRIVTARERGKRQVNCSKFDAVINHECESTLYYVPCQSGLPNVLVFRGAGASRLKIGFLYIRD